MDAHVDTVQGSTMPGAGTEGTATLVDVDTWIDPSARATIQALVSEGSALLGPLAHWAQRARPLLEHTLPDEVYEDGVLNRAVMEATGLGELNDLMTMMAGVIGEADSVTSDAVASRLLDRYGELRGAA